MASLAQLIAAHGSILVIDAASSKVQTGLMSVGRHSCWEQSTEEAGRGLFRGTEALLTKGRTEIGDIGAFVYCEGPGSMLGTRTVAMALRTWLALKPRPVFAYHSLALAARAEWRRVPRPFSMISDARRESWHVQPVSADGALGQLERRATTDFSNGELLTPAGFRVWSTPPANVTECSYDLPLFFETLMDTDLFRAVVAPEVLQHEAPDYKKWTAQPHSVERAART